MQQMSKGAQDEIFSSLRAWQELGRVLLLVSRKYQEALLFLLCSYNSFIGLWRAFFYWIMTWGRSMRDSLQTAQTAKLMQIVPGCACTCCSNVQPSTASYAGCVQHRAWMELFMQESCAHSFESSCIIPREVKVPHVGSWCLHSFIWCNFKIQCRNYFACWPQNPVRCVSPPNLLLLHPEKFCFFICLPLHQLIYLSLCPV